MAGQVSAGRAVLHVEAELDKSSIDKVGRDTAAGLRNQRSAVAKEGLATGQAFGAGISSAIASMVRTVGSSLARIGSYMSAPIRAVGQFVSGFRDARAAASEFSGRMGTLGGQVRGFLQPVLSQISNIGSGFRDSEGAAQGFYGTAGKIGGLASRVVQPFVRTVQAFGEGYRGAATQASGFYGLVQRAGGLASRAVTGFRTVVGRVGNAFQAAGRVASNVFAAMGRGIDRVAGQASQLGRSLTIATAPLQALAADALFGGAKRLMALENAEALLNTIGANTERVMASVDRAVTGTRFALNEAADMAALLAATGMDAGKETERWLSATADIAQASGRSFGEVSYVMTEVAQSGRAMGSEMRQLPLAVSALSKHLGVSQDEVRKLASEGKITADQWVEAIEGQFGGAAKGAGETFQAAFANVRTALARAGANFLEPIFKVLTKGFMDAAPAIDSFGNTLSKVGEMVASVIGGMIEGFKNLPTPVRNFAVAVAGIAAVLGPVLIAVGTFLPLLKNIGSALSLVANPAGLVIVALAALGFTLYKLYQDNESFRTAVQNVWSAVSSAISTAWTGFIQPALAKFWGFLSGPLWSATKTVFGAIVTAVVAVGTAIGAMWSVVRPVLSAMGTLIAKTWTGVIRPILTMFGSGLGTLWTIASTTFKGVVSAFQAVGTALSDIWTTYIKPPLMEWVNFFNLFIAPAISGFYNNVIVPVFTGIWTIITTAWGIIQPILSAMWGYFSTSLSVAVTVLGTAFSTYWSIISGAVKIAWSIVKPILDLLWGTLTNVIWPVVRTTATVFLSAFGLITGAIKLWWNTVAFPIFTALRAIIMNVVVPVLNFLWTTFTTIFNFISNVIRTWWNVVVRPIFNAVNAFIRNVLAPVIRWLWESIFNPIFSAIGGAVRSAWNNVIRPAFNGMKSGVSAVGTAFQKARDTIIRAWEKLKDIVATPIRASIRFVNSKLIGNLNKIPGVNISKIPVKFATGGPVHGPGTSTSDSILARLSRGEHVLSAKDVKLMGGHGRVEAMKAAARAGQFHIPGFAKGGNPFAGAKADGRGGRVYPVGGSKAWNTYPGHTGIDFPRPMGTPVVAASRGPVIATPRLGVSYGHHVKQSSEGGTSIYAHLSRILVRVGQMLSPGQRLGLVGSTGNSTGPHLHFERRPPGTDSGTGAWLRGAITPPGDGGAVGEAEISGTGWVSRFFKVDKVLNALKGWFKGKSGVFGPSDMVGMMREVVNSAWKKIKDTVGKIKDVASNMANTAGRAVKKLWPFDQGGMARGRGIMAKGVIKPERTLSPEQTRSFEKMVDANFSVDKNKGYKTVDQPITINNNYYGPTTSADRRRELEWTLRYSTRANNTRSPGAGVTS